MTTATLVPQQPASLLRVHRRGPTILKRPRLHETKKSSKDSKPILLHNLRNYYARRRPSMSISNKAPEEPSSERKVKFYPKVRVKRIPSRLAYSAEDKVSLWVPKKELKRMVLRNHAEYAFEGQDWQRAPEEDDFKNGKHPFYVWAEHEAAADREEESDDASMEGANDSSSSEDSSDDC